MATFSAIFAGIFGLGAPELVVILIILLVLFGGAKLPSLARGLGESIKEFKKASRDDDEPAPNQAAQPAQPAQPTSAPAADSATAAPSPPAAVQPRNNAPPGPSSQN